MKTNNIQNFFDDEDILDYTNVSSDGIDIFFNVHITNNKEYNLNNLLLQLHSVHYKYPFQIRLGSIKAGKTLKRVIKHKKCIDYDCRLFEIPKINTLQEEFVYSLSSTSKKKTYCQGKLVCKFEQYSIPIIKRKLRDFHEIGVKKINLLVMGDMGATKSSFINSLFTLFEKRIIDPVPVGGNETHVTTKLQRYEVVHCDDCSKLYVCDSPGITRENVRRIEYRKIAKGDVPLGFPVGTRFLDEVTKQKGLKLIEKTRESNELEIDGVFFFIPYNTFTPTIDPMKKKILEHVINYKFKKLPKVFIISLFDSCSESKLIDPLNPSKEFSPKEYKEKLVNVLKCSKKDVFFGCNYHEEKEKSFNIDRNNFTILCSLLEKIDRKKRGFSYK